MTEDYKYLAKEEVINWIDGEMRNKPGSSQRMIDEIKKRVANNRRGLTAPKEKVK